MDSSPGFLDIVRHWPVAPWWWLTGLSALAAYLTAYRRSLRLRGPHPRWQMMSFVAGVGLALIALASPLAAYSDDALWLNFTGFLLLTMMAPPLILLGSPLTLAFRVCGARRRAALRRFYRHPAVATLTFPVVTWLAFAVVTYVWQFTSLTGEAADLPALRLLQQAMLLSAGLLFWLPALAADPLRWRLPYPLRALYVMLEMTHKGLFGGMFLSMNTAMHGRFAAQAAAWAPAPIDDQRLAILILWLGGNVVFLLALAFLVGGWVSYERRNQHRTDLRLDRQREAARRRRAALEKVFDRPV